jgi:hypothetical protein
METAFLRHLDVESRHLDSVNEGHDAPLSRLISQWLEEGERLSELGDAVVANDVPAERRLRTAFARARTKMARHRGMAMLLAIGMSVIAIAVTRTFMHGVLAANTASAEPMPVVAREPPPVAAARVAPEPVATPEPVAMPEPAATPEPAAVAVAAPVADHVGACRRALRREHAQKALAACRRAAEARPTSADAVVLHAHAELLAGHQEETLRLARKAMAIDAGCAEAYLLIGNVQQMAGSKLAARFAYQSYLDHAPRGEHAAEVRAILRTL